MHALKMIGAVVIRQAQTADAADFASVRVHRGHDAATALRICREELEKFAGSDHHAVFLAYADGKPVGYGRAEFYSGGKDLYSTVASLPEGWYLRGLVVLPEARRSGVGRRLTEARMRWIEERAAGAYCFVDGEEALALPMYRALGFHEVYADWKFSDPAMTEHKGILLGRRFLR